MDLKELRPGSCKLITLLAVSASFLEEGSVVHLFLPHKFIF